MANEIVPRGNGIFEVSDSVPAEQVREKFPPASRAERAKAIAMLFTAMKASDKGDADAAMTAEIYDIALEGWPAWAVDSAVTAYIRGEVDGASKVFVPATAELAETVKRHFWARIRTVYPKEPSLVPVRPDWHFQERLKRGEVTLPKIGQQASEAELGAKAQGLIAKAAKGGDDG